MDHLGETLPATAPSTAAELRIGTVIAVSGFKLSCLLPTSGEADETYAAAPIGGLVKVHTRNSVVVGFIGDLVLHKRAEDGAGPGLAVAEIDLLGELIDKRNGEKAFARGVSNYPLLGAAAYAATAEDLSLIYARPGAANLCIGSLYQDIDRPAYLLSQEFLCKHSAILGTTGSGKSCAVALILRMLLTAHPNGHIVLLDPHGEYAPAFAGMAEIITPQNLQLPYWLLSFEEIVEVAVQPRSDHPQPRGRHPQGSHRRGPARLHRRRRPGRVHHRRYTRSLSYRDARPAPLRGDGPARQARQLPALSAADDDDREICGTTGATPSCSPA